MDLRKLSKDELLALASIGFKFKQQQKGKRPEFLQQYISGLVSKMARPSFKELLHELELAAARRELRGVKGEPIEQVNRVYELVTYHHPKKGRIQMPFETLRNKLTKAKQEILTCKPKS